MDDKKPKKKPQVAESNPSGKRLSTPSDPPLGEGGEAAGTPSDPPLGQGSEKGSIDEEKTALEISQHVLEAIQEESEEREKDKIEINLFDGEIKQWSDRTQLFVAKLDPLIQSFAKKLARAKQVQDGLPPMLLEKLVGRHEGLVMTQKMLSRLPDRINRILGNDPLAELPAPLTKEEWTALLIDEISVENIYKKRSLKLGSLGSARYRILVQFRERAGQSRKNLLNILEKYLFTILDGIDDGERFSATLIQKHRGASSEEENSLSEWFAVYDNLRQAFMAVLTQIGVRPMIVELGTLIDYERHEPFDVEPEAGMDDEAIKAVVRKGYEYQAGKDNWQVLRSAQVIVVKN